MRPLWLRLKWNLRHKQAQVYLLPFTGQERRKGDEEHSYIADLASSRQQRANRRISLEKCHFSTTKRSEPAVCNFIGDIFKKWKFKIQRRMENMLPVSVLHNLHQLPFSCSQSNEKPLSAAPYGRRTCATGLCIRHPHVMPQLKTHTTCFASCQGNWGIRLVGGRAVPSTCYSFVRLWACRLSWWTSRQQQQYLRRKKLVKNVTKGWLVNCNREWMTF